MDGTFSTGQPGANTPDTGASALGRTPARHLNTDTFNAMVDGTLTSSERGQAERHLASCPACQTELSSLSATVALLRDLPVVRAPRSFQLGQEHAVQKPAGLARIIPFPVMRVAAVAAMLVVVVVGGIAALQRTGDNDGATTNQLAMMEATEVAVGAQGEHEDGTDGRAPAFLDQAESADDGQDSALIGGDFAREREDDSGASGTERSNVSLERPMMPPAPGISGDEPADAAEAIMEDAEAPMAAVVESDVVVADDAAEEASVMDAQQTPTLVPVGEPPLPDSRVSVSPPTVATPAAVETD